MGEAVTKREKENRGRKAERRREGRNGGRKGEREVGKERRRVGKFQHQILQEVLAAWRKK